MVLLYFYFGFTHLQYLGCPNFLAEVIFIFRVRSSSSFWVKLSSFVNSQHLKFEQNLFMYSGKGECLCRVVVRVDTRTEW